MQIENMYTKFYPNSTHKTSNKLSVSQNAYQKIKPKTADERKMKMVIKINHCDQ
jgi:hypothetical protein